MSAVWTKSGRSLLTLLHELLPGTGYSVWIASIEEEARAMAAPAPVGEQRDSLDVERLGYALHKVYCVENRPMHSDPTHSADRIAAEYARLRAIPSPDPRSET
jgi:hypothetical protein